MNDACIYCRPLFIKILLFIDNRIYKICSKRVEMEVVFAKTEMKNEGKFHFLQIPLAFIMLIPVSFPLVESLLNLLF